MQNVNQKFTTYLSTVHGFVDDFEDEIGPNDMEHQEYGQETVENVISREHFHDLGSFYGCAIQYPGGVHPQTSYNPGQCETGKQEIAEFLIVGIFAQFGCL